MIDDRCRMLLLNWGAVLTNEKKNTEVDVGHAIDCSSGWEYPVRFGLDPFLGGMQSKKKAPQLLIIIPEKTVAWCTHTVTSVNWPT